MHSNLFLDSEHSDAKRFQYLADSHPRFHPDFKKQLDPALRDVPGIGDIITSRMAAVLETGFVAWHKRFFGSSHVNSANRFINDLVPLVTFQQEVTIELRYRSDRECPSATSHKKEKTGSPFVKTVVLPIPIQDDDDKDKKIEPRLISDEELESLKPPPPKPGSAFTQTVVRKSDQELQRELSCLVPLRDNEYEQLTKYIKATKRVQDEQTVSRKGGTRFVLRIPFGKARMEAPTCGAKEACDRGKMWSSRVLVPFHVWLEQEKENNPCEHLQSPFNYRFKDLCIGDIPVVEGSCLDPRSDMSLHRLKLRGEDPLWMDGRFIIHSASRRITIGAELKARGAHFRFGRDGNNDYAEITNGLSTTIVQFTLNTPTPPNVRVQMRNSKHMNGLYRFRGGKRRGGGPGRRQGRLTAIRSGRGAAKAFDRQFRGPHEMDEPKGGAATTENKWHEKMRHAFRLEPTAVAGEDPALLLEQTARERGFPPEALEVRKKLGVDISLAATAQARGNCRGEEWPDRPQKQKQVMEELRRKHKRVDAQAAQKMTSRPALLVRCFIDGNFVHVRISVFFLGLGFKISEIQPLVRGDDDDKTYSRYAADLNHSIRLEKYCTTQASALLYIGGHRSYDPDDKPKQIRTQGAWYLDWKFLSEKNAPDRKAESIAAARHEKGLVFADILRRLLHLRAGISTETSKFSLSSRRILTVGEFFGSNMSAAFKEFLVKGREAFLSMVFGPNDQSLKRKRTVKTKKKKQDVAQPALPPPAAAAEDKKQQQRKRKVVEPFWVKFDPDVYPDAPRYSNAQTGQALYRLDFNRIFDTGIFKSKFLELKVPSDKKKKVEGEDSVCQFVENKNLALSCSLSRRTCDLLASAHHAPDPSKSGRADRVGFQCGAEMPSSRRNPNTLNLSALASVTPGVSRAKTRALECYLKCHCPDLIDPEGAQAEAGRYRVMFHDLLLGTTIRPDDLVHRIWDLSTHPEADEEEKQINVVYDREEESRIINVHIFGGRIRRPVLISAHHLNGCLGPCLPTCVKNWFRHEMDLLEGGAALPLTDPLMLQVSVKIVSFLMKTGMIKYVDPAEMKCANVSSMPIDELAERPKRRIDFFAITPEETNGLVAASMGYRNYDASIKRINAIIISKQRIAISGVHQRFSDKTTLELLFGQTNLIKTPLSMAVDQLASGVNIIEMLMSCDLLNEEDSAQSNQRLRAMGALNFTSTARHTMATHADLESAIKDANDLKAWKEKQKKAGLSPAANREGISHSLLVARNRAQEIALIKRLHPDEDDDPQSHREAQRDELISPLTGLIPIGSFVLPRQTLVVSETLTKRVLEEGPPPRGPFLAGDEHLLDFLAHQMLLYQEGMTIQQYNDVCRDAIEDEVSRNMADADQAVLSTLVYEGSKSAQVRDLVCVEKKWRSEYHVFLSNTEMPIVADKKGDEDAQKGTQGIFTRSNQVPWLSSGIVSEMRPNPHGIPTRRTPGKLLRGLAGMTVMRRPGAMATTSGCEVGMSLDRNESYLTATANYNPHFSSMAMEHLELLCMFLDPTRGDGAWIQLHLDSRTLFPDPVPLKPLWQGTLLDLAETKKPFPLLMPLAPTAAQDTDGLRRAFVGCFLEMAERECLYPGTETSRLWRRDKNDQNLISQIWSRSFASLFRATLDIMELGRGQDTTPIINRAETFVADATRRRLALLPDSVQTTCALLEWMCRGPEPADIDSAVPWSKLWVFRNTVSFRGRSFLADMDQKQCEAMIQRLLELQSEDVYSALSGERVGRGHAIATFQFSVNKRSAPQMKTFRPGFLSTETGPNARSKLGRMELDGLLQHGASRVIVDRKHNVNSVTTRQCERCSNIMTRVFQVLPGEWVCVCCERKGEALLRLKQIESFVDPELFAFALKQLGLEDHKEDVRSQGLPLLTIESNIERRAIVRALGTSLTWTLSDETIPPRS